MILVGYKPFTNEVYEWLKKEIRRQAECQSEPKQVFIHATNLLIQHKIEIPTYHRIAELITLVYLEFEKGLLKKLNNKLKSKDKKILDALLNNNDSLSSTLLNQWKYINQSTKPKAIQASLAIFTTIKEHFLKFKPAIGVPT